MTTNKKATTTGSSAHNPFENNIKDNGTSTNPFESERIRPMNYPESEGKLDDETVTSATAVELGTVRLETNEAI